MPTDQTHGPGNDALARLVDLIATCLPALAMPGDDAPIYLSPRIAVTAGEADGFFRAIDAELFDLSPSGYCRPQGMRPSTGYAYPLLERPDKTKNAVRLWR